MRFFAALGIIALYRLIWSKIAVKKTAEPIHMSRFEDDPRQLEMEAELRSLREMANMLSTELETQPQGCRARQPNQRRRLMHDYEVFAVFFLLENLILLVVTLAFLGAAFWNIKRNVRESERERQIRHA